MPNLAAPVGLLLSSSLFEARLSKTPKPSDKPKYFARIGYTAEAQQSAEFKALQAAVVAAAREKWGQAKADAMLKEGSIRLPFRKEIAANGYPEHLAVFIGGSSLIAPGVLSRFNDPATGKRRAITTAAEIYPGCSVVVSWSVRAYGGPGTGYDAGVALDLRNVLKWADGERLAREGDATSDFGETGEADTTTPGGDDLSALMS